MRKPILAILLLSLVGADPRPPITRVWIGKSSHTLKLFSGTTEVKAYKVAIGPGGAGFKHQEGDKVTPVGHYHVTIHQPSRFKIFLRLDYPQQADWERFGTLKKEGKLDKNATIGGDIGIHGIGDPRWSGIHKLTDWTLGCIALDDDEITEVAGLVNDGTVVDIED
jgi:murein L,D-transpeptidase YafK